MKKLVIGILAHVDAGKTTLSESILYQSGKIEKLGRVDNKDAYLDNEDLERARGITIFSKQALFEIENVKITLLDTPGHIDFSAEMERTLQVLDCAILVISGRDGVQGHTNTLWRLLKRYQIPTFIFVNKMDQEGTDQSKRIIELEQQLGSGCIDFSNENLESFYEHLAMCDEEMLEDFLEKGKIEAKFIRKAIWERKVFPCYFGSALKVIGVEQLLLGIVRYAIMPSYSNKFGAKVFKITRDEQGKRLTHLKVTGGKLKIRDLLSNGEWEEKVNQIRIYSGQKFELVTEVEAGEICAIVGLNNTKSGEGLGFEKESESPILEPVLSYQMKLPSNLDHRAILPKLYQLEEEVPELHIVWNEELQEIQAQIMGEVQIEILQSLIESRFGVNITFDEGRIVYKETIANIVEGVGHFEPLRHYAEVHLILEPGESGSGLQFATKCSEDILSRSWQRLVLTHLEEKVHRGVLIGAPITDMKITLVLGKAHNKHTEGGDFREATYRAVRQGLMEAESVLLEPYYSFWLELPSEMVGRAMTDIEKMYGNSELSKSDGGVAFITGSAPVLTMRNYQKEVTAYTKGLGKLFYSLKGYGPCHNAEEVIAESKYDPERDINNPTGSVFCSQGAGFLVPWNEVKNYMHMESYLQKSKDNHKEILVNKSIRRDETISLEEIDKIISSTFYSNQGKKNSWNKFSSKKGTITKDSYYKASENNKKVKDDREEYLLVDGYNIIYAWPDLKELADQNMDSARIRLLDILSNYQVIRRCNIIVVFDAYKVEGHMEEVINYHNICMVFTREVQTADQYIERFAYNHKKEYRITVATSDGLEQIIIRGTGSSLLSAQELKDEVEWANEKVMEEYEESRVKSSNSLIDMVSLEMQQKMKDILRDK